MHSIQQQLQERWISNYLWSLWKQKRREYGETSLEVLKQKQQEFYQAEKSQAEVAYRKEAEKELQTYLATHPRLSLKDYRSSFLKQLHEPNLVCSFHKEFDHTQALAPFYSSLDSTPLDIQIDQLFDKQLIDKLKQSRKSLSAGLLLTFPDGRIVIVEPTGHFGGYSSTFPKGRVEKGDSILETALKETLEETGFQARLDGKWHGLYEGQSTWVWMFSAQVIGGDPSQADFETDYVHLVPRDQVLERLQLNQGTWPSHAYQDFLKEQIHYPLILD